MALQASGAISLANVQTEFGGVNPISISEYYGKVAGIPASGAISLSHFYGKSNIIPLTVGFSSSSIIENSIGLQTSGFGYRAYYYDSETSIDYGGSWQAVSPIGIFSGDSNPATDAAGFGVSGSLLRVQVPQYNKYGDWVTFDIKTKQFTGNSIAQYLTTSSYRLTTAGGLIRFETKFENKYGSNSSYAQYVSLT